MRRQDSGSVKRKRLGERMRRRKKFGRMLLAVLMLGLLSACELGRGADCVGFQPLYLSPSDVLTPETGRAVLAHNEYGRAHCGWRPVR